MGILSHILGIFEDLFGRIVPLEPDDDTQLQYMTHIEKFSVLEVERELVRNFG